MSALASYPSAFPLRYRSLITLLALTVLGSLVSSPWLLPSRLERVAVATENGDQSLIDHELDLATHQKVDPGEARALVDVALTVGSPETAAAILDQFLARQPGSVEGLRLLINVQRQRHLAPDVAALDERLYALTGDSDALRESADIYASRHMTAERVDALRRLAAIGRATASDISELAHRLAEAGDADGALAHVMKWLARPQSTFPAELLALAAGLSAGTADAPAIAAQLGALIGRNGQVGPLHVLIQTYAERGHPALSLMAGRALGDDMTAKPEVALALAQLEALQGEFAAARARLDALDRAGNLLPAGIPMLVELSLQASDLARATTLAASLTPDQMPEGLPHRMVEAIDAAGRTDLLARLPLETIATSSPASAASIALARGDRRRATTTALAALGPGADQADLGPAFGRVLRTLGLEHDAIARLLVISQAGALENDALALLIDLASTSKTSVPSLLDALLAQRDRNPHAGMVWALLAARSGHASSVAAWLVAVGSRLPAQTLIDLLLLAVDRGEAGLARAAVGALAGRGDLPSGWTQAEIALTEHAREPTSVTRLRSGIDLLGAPSIDDTARDRVTAVLVGAPGFAQVAPTIRLPDAHPAITWLARAAASDREADLTTARLELLAAIAPQRALGLLAGPAVATSNRLLPIHTAALLRTGRATEAEIKLREALERLSPKQRDTALYDTLARLSPSETLPVLRVAAGTGRADWLSAYEDRLARVGMRDELRTVLRAEAASGRDSSRLQSLASRLVDLNDRAGAIEILQKLAVEKPPGSPEVDQLMFLWGPRATPTAAAWTRDQALAAPLSALPKWLEHLAYLGDPGAVVTVVEQRPAALAASAEVVRAYGAARSAAHAQGRPDLHSAIAAASAPDLLIALAQLALDTAQPASAWQAARAAVAASPSDPAALLLAAEAAAGVRRSDEAATYYSRLLALGRQSIDICVDAGDALLAAKRPAEGRKILEAALIRLSTAPATLPAARMHARVLMLLFRNDEAAALITEWLARYPNHAGLQADLMQARLDRQSTTQRGRENAGPSSR